MKLRVSKDNLPDALSFKTYRKRGTTVATPLTVEDGVECVIETQEAAVVLVGPWEGMLAIDRAGYPYPIAGDEFLATYTPKDVE